MWAVVMVMMMTTINVAVSDNAIELTGWTGYTNKFDKEDIVSAPDGQVFAGVGSYHDNDKEDRQFRYRFRETNQAADGSLEYHGYSNWDAHFALECSKDKAIRYWRSYHKNDKEDRRFKIGCQSMTNSKLSGCAWTSYVNDWDEAFGFVCGYNSVLTGVRSHHSNHYEDRRFGFRCCAMDIDTGTPGLSLKTVMRSDWITYENEWDGPQTTSASTQYAFCGFSSYHNNHNEDRRFRFKFCSTGEVRDTGGTVVSDDTPTAWDSSWTRTCPINEAIVQISSFHSNHNEDRTFSISCSRFMNTEINNCNPFTHYVNDWDSAFDFECSTNFVLAGIRSYHDNHKEDRRFSFKCCRMDTPV